MVIWFNLIWFVFLVWGIWLHYRNYQVKLDKVHNELYNMNAATRFTQLIEKLFDMESKSDVVDFLDEHKAQIVSFVESIFNEVMPDLSIFSARYITVLLYRAGCIDKETDLDKKVDDWSREAHMFFMLIVMDIRLHGNTTIKKYWMKFSKAYKLFVHMTDFLQYAEAVNKMGMLLRELHTSRFATEDPNEKQKLDIMYENCTDDLMTLVGAIDYDETLKKLLVGETYIPELPEELVT